MIKLPNLSEQETQEIIPPDTLLLGFVGSVAHSTYVPKDDPQAIDDKDIMGICVAPNNVYLGLKYFEQKIVKKGEWDSVVYEIKKYFHLLLKQNPNVISLLWLLPQNYIHIDPLGQLLLDNRNIFTSKQAYHSFCGYSHAQLYRMTHFPNVKEAYMGEKRFKLVEKYGYDTKNAAHLIRLLRMSIEFLTDGIFQVHRKDASELKEIKRGEWSLEKVKTEADRLFVLAQEAYVRSPLPPKPDYDKAEELLMDILQEKITRRTGGLCRDY